jgi:ACS family hexuronate transporter-like MFS transporter
VTPPDPARHRWLVLAIFVLSSSINYLDRQTLATLASVIRQEYALSNQQFGYIITAFSLTYAFTAPFAGLLIDRVGLTRAIVAAVAVWSVAGIATGFSQGLAGLVVCRAILGLAEAAGIPAAGKAIHQYLRPAERAVGNAINQAGVSLGLVLAPPVATLLAVRYGWRNAFVLTGLLGLLWIPLWLRTSRLAPAAPIGKSAPTAAAGILSDRRLWAFMLANAVSMIGYSLWTNWTTLYLIDVHRLTLSQAAYYAWIPPVFATAGGMAGGWASMRWMERGRRPLDARFRACFVAALLSLPAAGIPLLPSAALASAGISLAIFAVSAFSVNMYSMPLDAFGGARAAFAVSTLVASYGAVQAVVSPLFGKVVDAHGYAPLCWAAALMPLAASGVLRWSGSVRS